MTATARINRIPVVSHVHDRAQDRPFATFGEQLNAIRAAEFGQVDPRLHGIFETYAAASGASESAMSDGGFLTQPDFASEIMTHATNQGEILKRVRTIPTSPTASGLHLTVVDEAARADGSRYGTVATSWIDEAGTTTARKIAWRKIAMDYKKLIGISYASDELAQDVVAFGSLMEEAFVGDMIFMSEAAIVGGTGAGTPLGILKSPALITQTKTAAEATGDLTLLNLATMYTRLWSGSATSATWLMSRNAFAKVFTLTASTMPIFPSPTSKFGSLWGCDIIICEHCQTVGQLSDVILADLKSYLWIAKDPATAMNLSIKWSTDERAFRYTWRVNGMPAWAAPVTPKNSAATQSPFVTLEARP